MKFFAKYWSWMAVILIALTYTVMISYLGIQRSRAFASGYDLANMTDTVWQTTQGHFFALTGDAGLMSRFNIHTDLILVLLAPLYMLYPSSNLLLIIQALAVGISVIPIFLISRKYIKNDVLGIIVGIVFLMNPNTLWANMYDFHPILLAIPLLFFAFYFLMTKKWLPFWIVIGLALLTKENVGLFVAMMGVMAYFKFKEKKIGIILFVLGTTVTVLAIKVIMPHFSGGKEHWAMGWYNFSSGLIGRTWQSLTNIEALKYYRDLLVPYSFLPLLALPWMLPALPDLFINITSEHSEMKSLVFHYQSLTMVVLTIALIMAIARIKKHHEMLALGMLMLGFFTIHQNYFYSPLPTTPGNLTLEYAAGENEKNFDKALAQIPEQSIVASSSEVRPHIINHKLSYNLPGGVDKAEYVALVSQNRLVGDHEPKPYETELQKKLDNNPKYKAIYQVEPFYLYQKIN